MPLLRFTCARLPAGGTILLLMALLGTAGLAPAEETAAIERRPVDLVSLPGTPRCVAVNEASGTVSLVDWVAGRVLHELPAGQRPGAIAATATGSLLAVTARQSGELRLFAVEGEKLRQVDSIPLGYEPLGVAFAPDGRTCYVAQEAGGTVAVVDLEARTVVARIAVGAWPRYLALSPDGSRLAVGVSGERGMAVVDLAARQLAYREVFSGLNLGHVQISGDGRYAYFPWIVYGTNPITVDNIRRGWVIASRIARVRLDGPARREAIALDPRGEAVGDPHGLALSPDEGWIAVTASGTHELLIYRLAGLPFQDYGGPGDTIDEALLADRERFFRIPLGGRPMAVRFVGPQQVVVANALASALQVVSLAERRVLREIPLGKATGPSLAKTGEAIFYDAKRSLDGWYSCHSCHYEGGTNAVTVDTRNDGRFGNFKTVLDLRGMTHTAPYTWHGWQADAQAAMHKSLAETMLGPDPTEEDAAALVAYFDLLAPPPSSFADTRGEAAARGADIFRGTAAACSQCHAGPEFTDGQIHDVGTGTDGDRYQGFNTPSLRGVHRRVKLLHDGRARTLAEVLQGDHRPERVAGERSLTDQERADLIEYLKTL